MNDKNSETMSANEDKDFDSYQNKPGLVARLTRVNKKNKNEYKQQDKLKNAQITHMDDTYLTNYQKNSDDMSTKYSRKRRRLNDDET